MPPHARSLRRPSWRAPLAALALGLVALPATAHAGGIERTTPGARETGRAGASIVGGDSPMGAMFYNPANLMAGGGRFRIEGALHLHFSHECLERVEVIEAADGSRSAGVTYPDVCGDLPPAAIPEAAASYRINDQWALGFSVYVPPAASRFARFGDPDSVTIEVDDGMGGTTTELTPTRYTLIEQELLQAFFELGVAYEPDPRFRVGLSLGFGFTKVNYASAAYARVQVIDIGIIDPVVAYSDARTELEGVDGFVPRVGIGAWAKPVPDVGLELGASFHFTGDVQIDDATLHLSTIQTTIDPAWVGDLVGDIEAEGEVHDVKLNVPMAPRLAFGVRYALPLSEAADAVEDRLSSERFDVELDVVVNFGKRVDRFHVDPPEGSGLTVPSPIPGLLEDIFVALPETIDLEKRWKTQVAVRLGSDLTLVPGVLAVRGGFSYESDGVQNGYQGLDFQPFRQFGLHAGATVRIAHHVDFSVGYAHIFVPTVNVSVDEAQVRRTLGGEADPMDPADAQVVNAGRFRTRSDILIAALSANY